jgi:hypothetical protein
MKSAKGVPMRIWRQLDLYLTTFAAVAVGAMGMLGLAGSGLVAGATLSTMGVLATTVLAGRLQLRRLNTTTSALSTQIREGLGGPPSADRLLRFSRPGADADLRTAHEIAIIGVTLNRTLRTHLDDLRNCLRRGGVVRIAVIDPARDVVTEAARRSTIPDTPEIFAHRLRPTLDLLRELAGSTGPGRMETRLIGFVPAVGLLMIDPAGAHGQVRVEIYSHRFAGPEPTLPLRAGRDHLWYRYFRREFEQIWSAGRPVPSTAGDRQGFPRSERQAVEDR